MNLLIALRGRVPRSVIRDIVPKQCFVAALFQPCSLITVNKVWPVLNLNTSASDILKWNAQCSPNDIVLAMFLRCSQRRHAGSTPVSLPFGT